MMTHDFDELPLQKVHHLDFWVQSLIELYWDYKPAINIVNNSMQQNHANHVEIYRKRDRRGILTETEERFLCHGGRNG